MVGVNKKRTTCFLLSDLVNNPADNGALEDALKIASSRHDIMAVRVFDRRDAELPDVGIIELRDAETGAMEWVDTSSRRVRRYWAESYAEHRDKVCSLLRHHHVDIAEVATDGDYVVELIKMFKQR